MPVPMRHVANQADRNTEDTSKPVGQTGQTVPLGHIFTNKTGLISLELQGKKVIPGKLTSKVTTIQVIFRGRKLQKK